LVPLEDINNILLNNNQSTTSINQFEALGILNLIFSAKEDFRARLTLAHRFYYGYGLAKDCHQSATYYKLSANEYFLEHEAGKKYTSDRDLLNDEESYSKKQKQDEILNYYKYSADKGITSSQLVVAHAYLAGGKYFEKNPEMAKKYFEKAASLGEREAYGGLGNIYLKGIGVKPDYEKAKHYFEIGANLKDGGSYVGLGKMHLHGKGVPINEFLALQYFNKSSISNFPEGLYNLGLMYLTGKGVSQHYQNAFNLLLAASTKGYVLANYFLGEMYLNGYGILRNCDTAVKYYKSVAEKTSHSIILDEAFENYNDGDYLDSLLKYI
jgi:SEL1 protein